MTQHRFTFDKLVRDRVPEIMRSRGSEVWSKTLEHGEYLHRLSQKLVEEAEEVVSSTPDGVLEELADVLEDAVQVRLKPGHFGVGQLQVGQAGHVPDFPFRDPHACAFFRDAL